MWHSYEQEITSFFPVKWTLGAVLQSADDHSSKRTSLMVIMSCEEPIELLVVSRLVLSGVSGVSYIPFCGRQSLVCWSVRFSRPMQLMILLSPEHAPGNRVGPLPLVS